MFTLTRAGVLMRFPFRREPSKISDIIPTHKIMRSYLQSFKDEAPLFLLFLKTVERVQFLEFEADGNMREVFAVELRELSDDVRAQRKKITQFLKSKPKGDPSWLRNMAESVRSEYVLRVHTGDFSRRWLVLNSLSHGSIAAIAYEGYTVRVPYFFSFRCAHEALIFIIITYIFCVF